MTSASWRARVMHNRSAGLDALRSLACILVVVFHMRTLLVTDFGVLNPVIEGGNTGVIVFFALSGYLLYRPFVRGDVDLRSYAIKRAARILPGYFVALIALAILTGSRLPIEHPLPYLSMTASYNIPLRGFLGVAWTLSAELLFYLLLPLAARYVRGREILRLDAARAGIDHPGPRASLVLSDANIWLVGSISGHRVRLRARDDPRGRGAQAPRPLCPPRPARLPGPRIGARW